MNTKPIRFNTKRTGQGVPFVWAHGLTSSMALEDRCGWFDWSILAKRFDVVRYDARGHGFSEASFAPQDYQWSSLALDMLAIVEKFGVGQAILGGQSMGCATALCAAVRAPEQAKGLVLVSPPTAWETRALQADGYDKFANMLESMGKETLIRFMRQMSFFPAWMLKEIPELNELYVDEVAKMNESSLVPILRGAKLCVFPERNLLKSLAMPTLILAWTDDPIHPVSTAEELHHLLPNSRLVVSRTMQELRGLTGLIGDYFG